MKTNLLQFFTASLFFSLSSCASLDKKLSDEARTKIVKAKIDNRDYVIDMKIYIYGSPDMNLSGKGCFCVSGDTLITWLGHVYGYGAIPPKNPERQDLKYLIQDYKQTEWRRGADRGEFLVQLVQQEFKTISPRVLQVKDHPSEQSPCLHGMDSAWYICAIIKSPVAIGFPFHAMFNL